MFASVLQRPKSQAAIPKQRSKILIIDDDEALADVLSCHLERQGFETVTAESGESGLAKARSERPALIVLDLRLPDIDGLAVCGQLADSSETCAVPVIILSGLQQPDILRRCRAAGCHYFVHKPYDPNVLLTLIRHAIRDAASWGEAEI